MPSAIQARERVRVYWPSVAWIGLLLILEIQTWWSMFGLREHRDWNFLGSGGSGAARIARPRMIEMRTER